MFHRLFITILACLALVAGAVPMVAMAGGQQMAHPATTVMSGHADHAMPNHAMPDHTMPDHGMAMNPGCHDPVKVCDPSHPADGPMAGCVNGASCMSPVLGASLPVQYSILRSHGVVVWPTLERQVTALSIPPTLRPPRPIL